MDIENIFILAQKELRDARRNRWFLLYAVAFAALSLLLAWVALTGAGNFGLAGFGRTSASLINLVLLIVPLMGLTLGSMALAGEREQGSLLYLLAQPISQIELLLGKFIGLALALLAALVLGFGLTAALIALNGGGADGTVFLALLALSCLLAIVSLSLGFLISAVAKRGATAVGLALFLWLFLVFFGDLGLMGTSLVTRWGVQELLAAVLANPLQLFKLAAILELRNNLEILGPGGVYAWRTYGESMRPMLIALLAAWIFIPLLLSVFLFKRRGIL